MHRVDSTGAQARFPLLNYNTKIIILACRKVQFRQTDKSQSKEVLELKILYEQEIAVQAACSNRGPYSLLRHFTSTGHLDNCA